MSVPDSSQYPTTGNDTFPVVDGTVTLQTAQHSKLHNLVHSALANIQTYIGRDTTHYLGVSEADLSWDTNVIATLKKVALAVRGVKADLGTKPAGSAGSAFLDIANVSARTGTTADATTSTSAHGKINKINQTIGTTSDVHSSPTIYGAIAAANKARSDADIATTATLGQKLNLTGGTLTGALTTNAAVIANSSLTVESSNFTVNWHGSPIFFTALGYPTFMVPLTLSPATSDGHAVRKDQMDTALNLKADKPGTGQAMLRFTAGQSANPVTTWLGNNPNVLTSNPPVTNGNHTNGSNIQFQWVGAHSTIYAHIDAKTGVIGQDGVLGSGSQIRRFATLPEISIKPPGWPTSSRAVVSVNNSIQMLWFENNTVVVGVDDQQIGNIQWAPGSSLNIKNLDFDTKPDYEGFFDSINTAVFHYKTIPQVGAAMAGQHHVGFIAEEVEAAAEQFGLPRDVVTYGGDGLPSGLSDRDMIAVLWNIVKKMKDTQEIA